MWKVRSGMVLVFLFSQSLWAQNYQQLSQRLIQLRHEVEVLSSGNDELTRKNRMEKESLQQRQMELTAQIRKERLRQLQLKTKKEILGQAIRKPKDSSPQDKKLIEQWIVDLKGWVTNSLPFRTQERLAQLQVIEQKRLAGEGAEALLYDLWNFTENELRLGQDNAYEIMAIDLNGELKKAEVVRLGLLQMYYKVPEGEVGYAVPKGEGWILRKATNNQEVDSIKHLISSMKNRPGTGYFELPGLVRGDLK